MSTKATAPTPGPWTAERLRLDHIEWFVQSEARNAPPYSWNHRMSVRLPPLTPTNGLAARCVGGSAETDEGTCPLAIAENAANAHLIAACPTMYEYIKRKAKEGDSDAAEIIAAIANARNMEDQRRLQ